MVVDEAHRLKGRGNKLGDVLRKMEFGCKLLLTGTPLQVESMKGCDCRTTRKSCGRC